ncbi:MAG: histidine phosphatase family protein [Gammaproteobacteria bacterium]|nr:MAG: histidine phosphatase family protein [Gammaproteobacteria bacterium]
MQTRLDYLRHGLPVGGSRYRGHGIDDPLSEEGWAQMRKTTERLDTRWDRIITSPLARCAAFAQALGAERDIPVAIEPDLREVGFGRWEGMTRRQLLEQSPEEYHAFYADPVNHRPAGAEPLGAFGRRVAKAFDQLVERHSGEHLLVVAHAGVIRATLGHVLQAPPAAWYRATVDNAAVSRFVQDDKGAQLVWHNWRPAID